MRVIMVTPDAMIDRRIMQEASTLQAAGDEVIIIATPLEGAADHEVIGGVKVDRSQGSRRAPVGPSPRQLCGIRWLDRVPRVNRLTRNLYLGNAYPRLALGAGRTAVRGQMQSMALPFRSRRRSRRSEPITGPTVDPDSRDWELEYGSHRYLSKKRGLRARLRSFILPKETTFSGPSKYRMTFFYADEARVQVSVVGSWCFRQIEKISSLVRAASSMTGPFRDPQTHMWPVRSASQFALGIQRAFTREWLGRLWLRRPLIVKSDHVGCATPRLSRRERRVLGAQDFRLAGAICYYRPDLIHAHDLPVLGAGLIASRVLGVPLIYDAHEVYPEICTLTRQESRTLREKESVLVPHVDLAITVNPYVSSHLAETYGIAPPLVITNAVDPPGDSSPLVRDVLHRILGLELDSIIVIFQGWFSRDRNLDVLPRTLLHCEPNVHVVLLGYGEYGVDLLSLAAQIGVGDRTHLLEAVSQEELLFYISSADIGVIPYQPVDINNKLCSPNKLFEFIQAGLPIVASDLPYLRSVIAGEGFGLVGDTSSPEVLAGMINRLADRNSSEVKAIRQRLVDRRHLYSWEPQGEVLLRAYRELFGDMPM